MNFTYVWYKQLLEVLRENGYRFSSYNETKASDKHVILRHDIDYDILKALDLAHLENSENVKSTYFVLVTSELYNIFSKKSIQQLKEIVNLGHEIGLHFDETVYQSVDNNSIIRSILNEKAILENAIENHVSVVSMHRPSKMILNADLVVPGMTNSYSYYYFQKYKYLSDSRRKWKENVEEIITSGVFSKLHILTHAFWYNEHELSLQESIKMFINEANRERYETMKDNITDIDSIIAIDEVK